MTLRLAALLVCACLAGGISAQQDIKDQDGYTALARLLFDQRLEKSQKLQQLQRMLDAGANVNGNHGGWGRAGALGHARREEPEVIALLVARGATLAAPEGGGPVTIAIEMERDDLALALLGRDRKVGPLDRATLPLAARRGWRHVVTALLEAGADVNADDIQGMTALANAERRRDAAMKAALVAAGARSTPRLASPTPDFGTNFANVAAREIDDVVFFDPPRFALGRGREGGFAFYGNTMNDFQEVQCERSASFGIIAMANMAGGIRVGICLREVRRVRALAAAAQPALEAMLAQLSQGGAKLDPAMLEKFGWKYARTVGAGGAEEHYFPLILIGHGVGNLSTLVRISRGARRAIVVQADTMRLCENYGLKSQTPLCSDTRQALADLARRIDSRFSD